MKSYLLYIITLLVITSTLSYSQSEEITEEITPKTIAELEAKLTELNKQLEIEEAKIDKITEKAKTKLKIAREKGEETEIRIATKEYDDINNLIIQNVSPLTNEIMALEEELLKAKENEDNTDFLDEDGESLFDIDEEMKDITDEYLKNSPTINIQYGQTISSLFGDLSKDFSQNDFVLVKLGMTDYNIISNWSENLIEMDFKYLGFEQRISELPNSNGASYKSWAFLFGKEEGKGWKISEFLTITPYTGESSGWTQIDFIDSVQGPALQSKLDRLSDGIRYIDVYNTGINIQLNKTISIKTDFSTKVVYPRYLIWKHIGNSAIVGASHYVTNLFVKKINKRAPMIAPIMDFIFTNSINYIFLELQKNNMNWPWPSEEPFMEHNFNIGLSVTF